MAVIPIMGATVFCHSQSDPNGGMNDVYSVARVAGTDNSVTLNNVTLTSSSGSLILSSEDNLPHN